MSAAATSLSTWKGEQLTVPVREMLLDGLDDPDDCDDFLDMYAADNSAGGPAAVVDTPRGNTLDLANGSASANSPDSSPTNSPDSSPNNSPARSSGASGGSVDSPDNSPVSSGSTGGGAPVGQSVAFAGLSVPGVGVRWIARRHAISGIRRPRDTSGSADARRP
ncbi:MAG: hypothetical protein U5Q44_06795 [Dehalococcoidia bacterium]|nr:hypothetical protein [Dehalococcoidia bacterium]